MKGANSKGRNQNTAGVGCSGKGKTTTEDGSAVAKGEGGPQRDTREGFGVTGLSRILMVVVVM